MRAALFAALVLGLAAPPAQARAKPQTLVQRDAPAPAKLLEPEQLVAQAEKLFGSLEYEQVLAMVQKLLADPALPVELRVRALALEGSSLAVTSDIAEAERPFRKLLRLKPDFELPPKSPPKILAAFRKVQTEERLLAEELEASRRQRQISRLELLDALPVEGRGGRPFAISLRVFDPDGSVSAVRVPYRKADEAIWQVLALQRDATGAWAGVVPSEVTAHPVPYALQLYVETRDAKGAPLLVRGGEKDPHRVAMSAGSVRKVSLPRPLFFVTAGLTVAAWGTSAVLGYQLAQSKAAFETMYRNPPTPIDVLSVTYNRDAAAGNALATACSAMLITAAGLTAASVIFALLVDWFD